MRFLSCAKKNRRIIAASVLVFFLYMAVTVLLTWPLAANPNRYYFSPEVPGDGISLIADN